MIKNSTAKCILILNSKKRRINTKTLVNLNYLEIPIFIIDDYKNNRKHKLGINQNQNNIHYHGHSNQINVINFLKRNDNNISFTKQLKENKMIFKNKKNYALLLLKILKMKHVILINDIDLIPENEVILRIFNMLKKYNFVSNIDIRINRTNNKINFIGFDMDYVTNYFISLELDDNIWLLLHKFRAKIKSFNYYKSKKNPINNIVRVKNRAHEYSKLVIDGLDKIDREYKIPFLLNNIFWKNLMDEKNRKIPNERISKETINQKTYFNIFSPSLFTELFRTYFVKKNIWDIILNTIEKMEKPELKSFFETDEIY